MTKQRKTDKFKVVEVADIFEDVQARVHGPDARLAFEYGTEDSGEGVRFLTVDSVRAAYNTECDEEWRPLDDDNPWRVFNQLGELFVVYWP